MRCFCHTVPPVSFQLTLLVMFLRAANCWCLQMAHHASVRTAHKTLVCAAWAVALLACLAMICNGVRFAAAASLKDPFAGRGLIEKKTGKVDTPIIICGDSSQASINIKVIAGADTGAPAGFSLQWMTQADYDQNGSQWYLSNDSRLCKASFSGNANLSNYNLAAGEYVVVNVGDFLFDSGASSNCVGDLECDTLYVFRAFAHATSTLNRSAFTPDLTCKTKACGGSGQGCTYTQGYWKTHGPTPLGNNEYTWPESVKTSNMYLGTVGYNATQLQSIFDTPAKGNGLIALAHQLIAAKLNVDSGAGNTAIADIIVAADALIGGLVVPPVGSGYLDPSSTSGGTNSLAAYNEGSTGPGHCGSLR
jgi:hypothetical protein